MTDRATGPSDPPGDDDTIFEDMGQAVADVLAVDMEPVREPEDRWERRQRLLDSWTAIILAIAAVATAWASFQAGQWAGDQSDRESVSAIQRSDANRASSEATAQEIVNSQMWLSWLNAEANGQKPRAAFFRQRFSPELDAAQREWLGTVPVDAQGNPVSIPPGTPLDLPSYVVPAQANADRLGSLAEENLAAASESSGRSTAFVLLAVLFALVLFFASIATKFTRPKTQVLLILISIVLLVYALIRMLLEPQLL